MVEMADRNSSKLKHLAKLNSPRLRFEKVRALLSAELDINRQG